MIIICLGQIGCMNPLNADAECWMCKDMAWPVSTYSSVKVRVTFVSHSVIIRRLYGLHTEIIRRMTVWSPCRFRIISVSCANLNRIMVFLWWCPEVKLVINKKETGHALSILNADGRMLNTQRQGMPCLYVTFAYLFTQSNRLQWTYWMLIAECWMLISNSTNTRRTTMRSRGWLWCWIIVPSGTRMPDDLYPWWSDPWILFPNLYTRRQG